MPILEGGAIEPNPLCPLELDEEQIAATINPKPENALVPVLDFDMKNITAMSCHLIGKLCQ